MGAPLPPAIQGTEELREALLSLRREHEALAQSSSQAQHLLDALESLLAIQLEDDPFARVFASLRKVFHFDQALMLSERGAGETGADAAPLECIVAEPATLVGLHWPVAALFRKVLDGRVVATFDTAAAEEWRHMAQQVDAWNPQWSQQSALHLPVRTRERRGILILLRPSGVQGFDRADVALAKRFSVLASHALAARFASQTVAESQRLRELSEQLRESERATRRTAELLQTLVNVLPVGVAVQDADGRVLLVNHAAAAAFSRSTDDLLGAVAFDLADDGAAADDDSAHHEASFTQHLHSGEQRSRECQVLLDGRERTVLLTGKPVRIFDEQLLLSTSLDITERKQLEEDLARRAFHDALTGLPNRTRMQDVVGAALQRHERGGGKFGLAFIDLDNFKQVNDYYSHAIGDALLLAVTQRITNSIRAGDTLARISGDEFLLLIDPLAHEDDLPPLVERVIETLKQPFMIEGHELLTSASVGAAIYPLHGDSYEALCRCADSAMYRAKHQRKGSAAYFNEAMGQALTARMETEQRLRAAIREKRFRAAFQPKLRLASGRVDGFEALMRWVDPDGSVHLPGTFIEVASELGLLDDITWSVLDDVALHLPALTAHYGPHLSISLNVAARQAGDVNFMNQLTERLVQLNLGRRIVLELTEDALLATQRFQREVLPRLRSAGVRVSVDDFGTGYSSLATLADITADEVKVDRSLISAIHERPRSQGILRAIESLCSALGAEMVAEGVETAEELAYLKQHTGIALVQGHHFSRPRFMHELLPVASPAA